MLNIKKIKKFILNKRYILSIISSNNADYVLIKTHFNNLKKTRVKTFTLNYQESDFLILSGYFTLEESNYIYKIVNSLKTKTTIIIFGECNLDIRNNKIKVKLIKNNLSNLSTYIDKQALN